jgi:hypothetical protein
MRCPACARPFANAAACPERPPAVPALTPHGRLDAVAEEPDCSDGTHRQDQGQGQQVQLP